jgi:hypothetical protein
VDREEVIARRLAAHGLLKRRPAGSEAAAATACGLPDSPAGSARDALAARLVPSRPPSLDGLVAVWGPRGATYVVRPEDVGVFTRGALPPDEASARKAVSAPCVRWLEEGGWSVLDAVDATGEAMRDVVAAGTVQRDDLHEALRHVLPSELLWPCRGCGTRHAHPSIWRMAGLRGEVVHGVSTTRAAAFARFEGPAGGGRSDEEARRELVTRVLRCHGPLTAVELGGWLGTGTPHAKAMLALVETRTADRAGRAALELAEDPGPAPDVPPDAMRLLSAADPLLDTRDRETLVPDAALRKALWLAIGRPGAVLAGGELVGTWRPRTTGRRLEVRVDRFAAFDEAGLEAEVVALGLARGLEAGLAPV